MKTVAVYLIFIGIVLNGLYLMRVQRNINMRLTKENTQLKQEIIKANTTIEQANRILNNPDSTCIFIYSNPKHRRKWNQTANFNKMIETEFLALMHCGQYVDANLLEKGIYTTSKPFIYDKKTTIDGLKHQVSLMMDMMGQKFVSDKYLSNLEQCQLVPVNISVVVS